MSGQRTILVVFLVAAVVAVTWFLTGGGSPRDGQPTGTPEGAAVDPATAPEPEPPGDVPAAAVAAATAVGEPTQTAPCEDEEPVGTDAYLEVELLLAEDRIYTGWVSDVGLVEIYDPAAGKFRRKADTPANRALPGAGLTLRYVSGHKGSMFVVHKDIRRLTVLRRLPKDDVYAIWADILREEGSSYGILATAQSPVMIARGRELLERFPPHEWDQARFLALRREKIDGTRELSELEDEFVRVYVDLLKPAFEAGPDPAGDEPK